MDNNEDTDDDSHNEISKDPAEILPPIHDIESDVGVEEEDGREEDNKSIIDVREEEGGAQRRENNTRRNTAGDCGEIDDVVVEHDILGKEPDEFKGKDSRKDWSDDDSVEDEGGKILQIISIIKFLRLKSASDLGEREARREEKGREVTELV